jgi:hypothetical protein
MGSPCADNNRHPSPSRSHPLHSEPSTVNYYPHDMVPITIAKEMMTIVIISMVFIILKRNFENNITFVLLYELIVLL